MPDGSITKDRSASARNALRNALAVQETTDIQRLEDELSASAFAQQCEREWAAERARDEAQRREQQRVDAVQARQDRAEHITTEVLEVATSVTAGALSTWKSGGVPLGGGVNSVVGFAGKVGSILNPEHRALRVACRTGKVLLHSQISLITRNLIQGNS